MSDDKRCKSCGASFAGDTAEEALAAHLESFHPAGAPVERVVQTPTDVKAIGKDFGPAVSGLAGKIGDVSLAVDDHEERLKALEQDRRSGTDLDVLAEQVAGKLRASAATPAATAPASIEAASEPEGPTYADLQARAKELGISGAGKREELAAAIAAEESSLAAEAGAPPEE